jgi:hypothetical protein
MDRAPAMARLFWMTSGFVVWGAQFTIVYGLTAVACARGWYGHAILGLDVVRAGVAAATVLALAVTGLVLWRTLVRPAPAQGDESERFIAAVTLWVCGLSLLAIAYNGLPALILPACSA